MLKHFMPFRHWATTEAKTKTTKQKFDLMIAKLIELEN